MVFCTLKHLKNRSNIQTNASTQITLALAFTLPILGLIVYDFFLWIWRLLSTKPPVPLKPVEIIRTAPNMSRTSKSHISGAQLAEAPLLDKPAYD
jgi:hypothetical protein